MRSIVVTLVREPISNLVRTVHLAKNPRVGGIPANLARISNVNHSLFLEKISLEIRFRSDFLIITIAKNNEIQYMIRKLTSTFKLNLMAAIIQLKLKIEDKAKISLMSFLFNWEELPMAAVRIMDKVIKGLNKNMIRYIGANFCHVIRVIATSQDDFFITEMNQEWKGTLATFMNKAEIPP